MSSRLKGHLCALLCAFLWGTTFIATKHLLASFSPVGILFFRFAVGLISLMIMDPRIVKWQGWKKELLMAGSGLCGVTLYYLTESWALTCTLAANVSVITCTAPFFTGLLACFFLKQDKPNVWYFVGFVCAIAGIAAISLSGSEISLQLWGTVLAVLAAFIWGIYSILTKYCEPFGLGTVRMTRRFFEYGLIFMLPALLAEKDLNIGTYFSDAAALIELIYLGIGASAICFVSWNEAMRRLGAVTASVYIYLTPVVTVVASLLLLREPLTAASFIGMLLTLAGLVISEIRKE